MLPGTKSYRIAKAYQSTLVWSRSILAAAAILTCWAVATHEISWLVSLFLGLSSFWATLCHMAEGLIFRRVVNTSWTGPAFVILAIFTPQAPTLLLGVLGGTAVYLLLLVYVAARPSPRLVAGDRLYTLRHPLEKLIPFAFLAPEPLSMLFEPTVALYWDLGALNVPVWRVSLLDPPALHNYIRSRAAGLSLMAAGWGDSLTSFRRAAGIINLLDTLRRFEEVDLDGVALAASARLALSKIPETAREILREVLATLKPDRQKQILGAFDLSAPRSF